MNPNQNGQKGIFRRQIIICLTFFLIFTLVDPILVMLGTRYEFLPRVNWSARMSRHMARAKFCEYGAILWHMAPYMAPYQIILTFCGLKILNRNIVTVYGLSISNGQTRNNILVKWQLQILAHWSFQISCQLVVFVAII